MRSIVHLLSSLVMWVMPGDRADWARAMVTEADVADDRFAIHWLFGCLRGAAMERLRDNSVIFVATLLIGLSIVLFFEWHTDEPLVVLPVLLLVSFASGWIAPTRVLAIGLCLGLAISIAHALSSATGLMIPRYQKQIPSVGDWVTMTALIIPSMLAAFGGSRLAKIAP